MSVGIAVLAEHIRWVIYRGSICSKWWQGITIEHVVTWFLAELANICVGRAMESVRKTRSHVAWSSTILGLFLAARELFLRAFKLLFKFILCIYFETVF